MDGGVFIVHLVHTRLQVADSLMALRKNISGWKYYHPLRINFYLRLGQRRDGVLVAHKRRDELARVKLWFLQKRVDGRLASVLHQHRRETAQQ